MSTAGRERLREPRTAAGSRLLEREAYNERSFALIRVEDIIAIEEEAAALAHDERERALVTIDGDVWPWPGNTALPWQVWNEVPHPDVTTGWVVGAIETCEDPLCVEALAALSGSSDPEPRRVSGDVWEPEGQAATIYANAVEIVRRDDLTPGSDPEHDFDGPDPFGSSDPEAELRPGTADEWLRDLRAAVELMDTKVTPYGEREDGTTSAYIVADSTWHRVVAIARGATSENARAALSGSSDPEHAPWRNMTPEEWDAAANAHRSGSSDPEADEDIRADILQAATGGPDFTPREWPESDPETEGLDVERLTAVLTVLDPDTGQDDWQLIHVSQDDDYDKSRREWAHAIAAEYARLTEAKPEGSKK